MSARFRMLLQYRAAALAGLGTQIFFGLIRLMILGAFYEMPRAKGAPMSWPEVINYIWLGQATLLILPTWTDGEVAGKVRDGSVVYELTKPVDLYALWYSRGIANRTAPMLLRAVPMLIIAGLFFGVTPPVSFAAGCAWLASTASAILLSSAISTLLMISIMWTISGRGIVDIVTPLVWTLCGIIIPLPLFPEWMQALITVLPFRGLMDIPFRVYCGNIPLTDCAAAIGSQLLWTLALVVIGKFALSHGTRRLVVQGG
jgi:ABC-2 type transport system permease protein